ncbi:MAG: HIT domain-containing protein [Actinomycetota bacterium]
MERLWSPWRSQYVSTAGDGDGCIFCDALEREDDAELGVLYRTRRVFVILNAFPYNTGHLMVAPTRHVGATDALADDESHELMDVTFTSVRLLREAMKPHGFNLGMNLGEIAGAGVPGHLHMHIVPRWGGDTNFMPVVGETKVLPEMLADTEGKLRPLFASLPPD